jgi:hypothetical protein
MMMMMMMMKYGRKKLTFYSARLRLMIICAESSKLGNEPKLNFTVR